MTGGEELQATLASREAVPSPEPDLREVVQLAAADSLFFSKTFFPRTFRQDPAPFHGQMWNFVERAIPPGKRLRLLQVFRGGAKTTFLRAFTAKRIAYGVSHTILYISKSEPHAVRSVDWLRRQVELNPLFSSTFNLRRGVKWAGVEAQIIHGIDQYPINILGMGITGSVRGLNLDDFRPDLIILDDVLDEENTATPEQRQKIDDLIYGALKQGLAPASESPDAMMLGCQTPLNREDYSVKAENDEEWDFFRVGCWTEATVGLPVDEQESAWPARWASSTLRREKKAAIARNKASTWYREQECQIVAPEDMAFRAEWLRRWDVLPQEMIHTLAIDPVPPPTKVQIAKGFEKKDYEALSVVGHYGGRVYVREVSCNRGHDPLWTINEFFRLCAKYRVLWVVVETVAYQAVLAWMLRQAMLARRQFYGIQEFTDGHSKYHRITQGLTGLAAEGQLFIPPDGAPEGPIHSPGMAMFVQQFGQYPRVSHDDALESVAVAATAAQGRLNIGAEGTLPAPREEREVDRYGRPIEITYTPGLHFAP